MMTAAANTSNEFAPQSAASDANDAFAAAPERGRLIISGKSSDGIPSASPIGDRKGIEHFGNADAVPQLSERCLSCKAGIVRCCLGYTQE